MSEPNAQYRRGIDRMDHPLSHTAAVVAGVSFVVFAGCVATLLSDVKMLRSSNWWTAFVFSTSVMSVCLIGYFRPHSRAIYVPILLAGTFTLGLCVWHAWSVWHPQSQVSPAKGLYQSLLFFGAWIAWAVRTFWHLRRERNRGIPSR